MITRAPPPPWPEKGRHETKWSLALVLALIGVAVYAGNVLATQSQGFSGTTLAKATFGEMIRTWSPSRTGKRRSRRTGCRTSTSSRTPGTPALRRVHSQHWLAHPSRPEPCDRHPRHRDRLRRRRPDVHPARVHGEHAEQLVRRYRRRGSAHHPRRERRPAQTIAVQLIPSGAHDGRTCPQLPATARSEHSRNGRRQPGRRSVLLTSGIPA